VHRQTGSHNLHNSAPTYPVKVGTLPPDLKDVAAQLGCSIEELTGSLDL